MAHLNQQDFPISALRSVELTVPDLAEAERFYVQVWGLMVAGALDDRLYLRGTGSDAYLLALRQGHAASIESVTYRAATGTDLVALRDRMRASGARGNGEIGACTLLGGGMAFSLRDPAGRLVRVVQNDQLSEPDGIHEARPLRLAHVNINTDDIDRDVTFLKTGLGFEVTDTTKMMTFLRTGTDHHVIVLAKAQVNTLNHVAFLHEGWEDVMKASGRMVDSGSSIGWGPGRHGPGNNVFVYFVDPFGIVVEHTAEVLQVDHTYRIGGPEDWIWPAGRTDQWGIAPPKTDACKYAQLAIPFI